jgi:hypothetical protein
MDTHGNVAFRSLWSNDEAILRDGLDAVLVGDRRRRARAASHPDDQGVGSMDEVPDLAGQQARRDVRREAPPMYLMARLASEYRPLPPLGRGIAAMISLPACIVGVVAGVRLMMIRQIGRSKQ